MYVRILYYVLFMNSVMCIDGGGLCTHVSVCRNLFYWVICWCSLCVDAGGIARRVNCRHLVASSLCSVIAIIINFSSK